MKRRNLILALAAAGVVAAAVLWPRGREVDVVSVARAPLTQSVVATGRIATPARIVIGSPLAATVLEVKVREGDPVHPGQILARLRADDAEALVGQATAALAEAEARFAEIESVSRPVAAQQLAQAEANRKVAVAEAERARQLVAKGFYAQSKADDALRNAANAASAADTARAQLAAQQAGGSEREAARARVDQARAQLVNARARAAQLTLTAPAAGVVLTRKAEPGDVATAGKVLLSWPRPARPASMPPWTRKTCASSSPARRPAAWRTPLRPSPSMPSSTTWHRPWTPSAAPSRPASGYPRPHPSCART